MRSPLRSLARSLPILILLFTISCNRSGGGRGPDTNPPVFSGATAAYAITDTKVVLLWTAATDGRDLPAFIVYNVYMTTTQGGEDFSMPDFTTAPGAVEITIDNLSPDTAYYFVVRAMDTSGNEDSNTNEVSDRTEALPDTVAPTFAGATMATATSEWTIDVSWFAATDNVSPSSLITYNAYVATFPGGQSFATPHSSSPRGATSLVVSGLSASTTYYIVVRAEDAVGNEETNTVEVSATTWTPDTTPPTFLGVQTAVPVNSTRIALSWTMATDNRAQPNEISYNIYWANTSGGQNFAVPSGTAPAGATTHTVMSLNPNVDYYFVVRAVDPSGNEDSNTVERMATTPVSFGAQVLQVFTTNCTVSNCHGSSNPVLGLNLSNYSAVFNTAINIQATQPGGFIDRIEPGNSLNSYLQHKIDGTHASVGGSGDQMPRSAPPLPQTTRDLIRTWINQGALDN